MHGFTIVPIGFDWGSLSKGSMIVDVGGGVGAQSLALAKAFAHLQFIVEDRPSVISDAAKVLIPHLCVSY